MLLTQLKETIQTKQTASLAELCLSLGLEAHVLEPMMTHWIRKGLVECQKISCQGCEVKCREHQMIYRWAQSLVQ